MGICYPMSDETSLRREGNHERTCIIVNNLTDPQTDEASGNPEAAMCVRKSSARRVLQFTPFNVASYVLHRPASRADFLTHSVSFIETGFRTFRFVWVRSNPAVKQLGDRHRRPPSRCIVLASCSCGRYRSFGRWGNGSLRHQWQGRFKRLQIFGV